MPHFTTAIPEWEQVFRRIAARSGVIELSRRKTPDACEQMTIHHEADGSHQVANINTWRVRAFDMDRAAIIVERPWSAKKSITIESDELLDVLMVEGQRRWTFQCVVLGQSMFALNASKKVIALRLSRPLKVHDGQRRDFFRVDTAGSPFPSVHLWHLMDIESCAEYQQYTMLRHRTPESQRQELKAPTEPPIGEDFAAMVMDVSGGGLGMLLPRTIEWLLPTAPLLWTKITLPDIEEPLFAVSRVAHWRDENAKLIRVGVCFHFDHFPEYKPFLTDLLSHFTANHQRLQLQRTR
ncbi:MAG: hypothetical protein GC162_05250 [Planctomycetes bacterium]|nr:hypothetical protein [Planctomycetota bacterium]